MLTRRITRIASATATIAIVAALAVGSGDWRRDGAESPPPPPRAEPRVPAAAPSPVDPAATASIDPGVPILTEPRFTDPGDPAMLKSALDALSSGDIATATSIRDGLSRASLDRHLLAWVIATRGGARVPSSEIAASAQELATWPGAETMRRNAELALFREKPDLATTLRMFGDTPPLTPSGAILLARAKIAAGERDAARAALLPFWLSGAGDAGDEALVLGEFADLMTEADHLVRLETQMYAGRTGAAARIAPQAGAVALQKAWAAVNAGQRDAKPLVEAVPEPQRSTAYQFVTAKALRRQGKYRAAAEIMARAPTEKAALIDPDAWWVERRVLARELLDQGDVTLAYDVAAGHSAESPADAADAEFHAGWIALRGLKDAAKASAHFAQIAKIADGPISRARANYWLARAAEAGGPGDAQALYAEAARFGTTFYGQIAAQKLGRTALSLDEPAPSADDRMRFEQREAVSAIRRLEAAGYPRIAADLYRALADEIASPGELALLTEMAEARGDHFLALRIAKRAAGRSIDVGGLTHPTGVIPPDAAIDGSGAALAYAIARQESEFNTAAVSKAGALGLLQLMPGTARDVARQAGLPFSQQRLTTDAGYNASLGAAFLGQQLDRFAGSYVLTFAGYNAGPRRADEWVRRYGDPRGKDIDTVVDWIERIPFTETRNYVQRVMENYQVYKVRLTGHFDIAGDLVSGRKR